MKRGPWPLAVLSLGVFLGALDQTVVATLMPAIISDLEIPFTRLRDAAWIITGYLLGYTVAMPLIGRVADLRGRVRVYAACMAVFALASVACGMAGSLEWLVAARTVQAVGGGAVLPVALALAADDHDTGRSGLALGIVGAVAEAGSVLGPLYGATLVQWFSWRWVFYLNLPLALAIVVLVLRACPEQAPSGGSLDPRGGLLLGAALGALTLGLSREGTFREPSPATVALLASAVALLAAFLFVERRAKGPLVDPRLFHGRAFAAANGTNLLVGGALIVAMVDLPLWSATVLQRTATEGGMLLLRLTALIPLGAAAGGVATRYLGPRLPAMAGLLTCAASFLLLSGWPATTGDARMARDLAVGGIGFGLLLAPVTTTAIAWAGNERGGVAAALVTLMRMMGMMVGLSALTSYGLDRFDWLVRDLALPLPMPGETAAAVAQRQAEYAARVLDATVTVYHELFLAAAIISLAALVPAALLRLPGHNLSRPRSIPTT